MAVKVSVYGTADMKQITRARGELDLLEKQAMASSTGFVASMTRFGNSASAAGAAMSATGQTMTRSLTVPLAAVGFGLYKATEAAAADAKAQVTLATALQNTTGATKSQVAGVEKWITTQGKLLGVSDDQLRPALNSLATATKDVSKAQQLAGVAMDIAAAKGIPVETAAKALAKAYAGSTTSLGKMLPGIDAAALKSKDFGKIMDSVNTIVGGQAAKAADTEAGARERSRIAMSEAVETLGTAFLPLMTTATNLITNKVVPAIQTAADWFNRLDNGTKQNAVAFGLIVAAAGPLLTITGKLVQGIGATATGIAFMGKQSIAAFGGLQNLATGLFNASAGSSAFATPMMRLGGLLRTGAMAVWGFVTSLGAKIAAMAVSTGQWIANTTAMIAHKVAQGASAVATGLMTAAQWALNAAMTANPIGIVIVALTALTAGIVYLWNTNEGFRTALINTWNAIKTAATAVWNFLVNAFQNWGRNILIAVTGPVGILVTTLIGNWNSIKTGASTAWNAVVGFFREAPGRIADALSGIASQMLGVGRDIVQGLWNGISNGWSWLTDQVRNLANSLVSGIKSVLKIKSPSQVFMGIGDMMGQGLALGILGTADTIRSATNSLAQTATVSTTVSAGATMQSAGFGGSGSRSVTVSPGAIQITFQGATDTASATQVVQDAFAQLVRELRSA